MAKANVISARGSILREDGKVLKGPNYQPPALADCLPKPQLNYYDTNGK